jgi:acetoin utilization deacetylase AcuC-like enzyme
VGAATTVGPNAVHILDYMGDTWVSGGSLDAMYAAAGMVGDAVTAVFTEDNIQFAYCATRPPGTSLT